MPLAMKRGAQWAIAARTFGSLIVILRPDDRQLQRPVVDAFAARLDDDAVGVDVRPVRDEVDAVHVDRPRLHAVVAEEPAGGAQVLDRLAGADLGDHALVAGAGDLVPEAAHGIRRLAEADRL